MFLVYLWLMAQCEGTVSLRGEGLGFLAGNTFGYNSYGLVQTTNALFPTEVVAGGLGTHLSPSCFAGHSAGC